MQNSCVLFLDTQKVYKALIHTARGPPTSQSDPECNNDHDR